MSPLTAPYGTWDSLITAEAITKEAIGIADIIVDRVTSEVYHIESRPSEEGRCVLVHTASGQVIVGEGWNVRTAVHEYGGGAAIAHNNIAYFSNLSDGCVYQVKVGGQPECVSPGKPYRYACLEPHPKWPHLLVSILEDHTINNPSDIVNTLVVINTHTKSIHPLLSGADFYALPRFSPDGNHITWQQWHHPDMPWDGGEVYVADVIVNDDNTLSIKNEIHVAGSKGKISAGYPSWRNNDTLIFTLDESGYVNPWKYTTNDNKASPLFPEPIQEDFAPPFWSLNISSYALIDKKGELALFCATTNGRDVLYLVDLNGGSPPKLIQNPFVVIDMIRTISLEKEEIVFRGQKTDEMATILRCSLSSLIKEEFVVLKTAHEVIVNGASLPRDIISFPRPMILRTVPDESPLPVIYYPPYNPRYSGSSIEGEKPPCIVNIHGGPTGLQKQGLNWITQYFTSRGWAWLDVNYGGSSGYGRKYIERLCGNWGVVDVQDSITAAQTLSSSSSPYDLIDKKRLFIRGGSAGGYTVLATLSIAKKSDLKVFAGATSFYGVSDLAKLYEFTHKFESKYPEKLVGGTPLEIPDVYKARSPVYHADDIVTALLILQGEIDRVVPKEQAEAIYRNIKGRGGVVEYKLYPGEGHGFRKEENMRDACERELAFYERILKLK